MLRHQLLGGLPDLGDIIRVAAVALFQRGTRIAFDKTLLARNGEGDVLSIPKTPSRGFVGGNRIGS